MNRRPPSLRFTQRSLLSIGVALALTLGATGCSTPPPAPVVRASTLVQPFDQAIVLATDTLMQQIKTESGMFAKPEKSTVVIDPTLDAASGQQTAATQQLDQAIAERLKQKAERIQVLPFEAANVAKARWLLAGTVARSQNAFRIDLALVDVANGTVAAQSSAMAAPASVDMSPLAYYRDSPVVVKDEVVEGYTRTTTLQPGQKADAVYLKHVAAATIINDATVNYNAARYREALEQYRSALALPSGDQLRVLNGIYLSNVKLGQNAEAEEAFGRVVDYGIAHNRLGVKFLFNPGSTEFWSDPRVTSAYTMWLRQIARQVSSAKVCLDIVGHTSKTGPEEVNDTLSLKRAMYIKKRLSSESATVARLARTEGMGSRQNIVGSGSDDVVDALDRRVEFGIMDCNRLSASK